MILLIDNYDSFVHNLARYFARLGHTPRVVRNDALRVQEVLALELQAVVISPGPCGPAEAGCSLDLVRALSPEMPLLGVCLGHQTMAAALGGRVVRAAEPRHGRASLVFHDGDELFTGLPSPFRAGRYHSLVVEEASLPSELAVTARSEDGVVMALRHRARPWFGVQFHPESILTEGGYRLVANFLAAAGLGVGELPDSSSEQAAPRQSEATLPTIPVTF
ncbi:MAG: aminodeoxychorismate/anthranilate synthase component II [Pirellulales bacterium]